VPFNPPHPTQSLISFILILAKSSNNVGIAVFYLLLHFSLYKREVNGNNLTDVTCNGTKKIKM